MFIRKKKNKGGSYSIMIVIGERIAGKKHPVLRVLKNFGSASDKDTLEILLKNAEEYKKYLEKNSPKAVPLRITTDLDLKSVKSYNIGFYDIYGYFFESTFGNFLLNSSIKFYEQLKFLTIMRIAFPCSKRRSALKSEHFGYEMNVDSIYKMMDKIDDSKIDYIKEKIRNKTTEILSIKNEKVDVLFYDLTTISFETNTQDELRNFGFSKDGKHQHVQVMIAVIVTKNGLPIDFEYFPGNTFEGHTLIPVIEKLQKKYTVDNTVLIADAALMSKINLNHLNDRKINYIIAARIKNQSNDLKNQITDLTGYKAIIRVRNNNKKSIDKIKSKILDFDKDISLLVFHSTKRARKDAYDREKDLIKIKQYLNSTGKNKLTTRLQKSYVKINKGCIIDIDDEKLKKEAEFDGFFAFQTNIKNPNSTMILNLYKGLWQVEETFRISKSNLKIRPVFHYSVKRIKAHIIICYMALAIIRYTNYTLKMNGLNISIDSLNMALEKMKIFKIHHLSGNIFELLEDPPLEAQEAYRALNIKIRKKFQYQMAV